MTLEEKLAICKAWYEGKTIEISRKNKNTWETISIPNSGGLYLDFTLYDYRIKEEPKQSIAYCYKMEKSGHLIWFTKLIECAETSWQRCPEFDIISNKEKNNEI